LGDTINLAHTFARDGVLKDRHRRRRTFDDRISRCSSFVLGFDIERPWPSVGLGDCTGCHLCHIFQPWDCNPETLLEKKMTAVSTCFCPKVSNNSKRIEAELTGFGTIIVPNPVTSASFFWNYRAEVHTETPCADRRRLYRYAVFPLHGVSIKLQCSFNFLRYSWFLFTVLTIFHHCRQKSSAHIVA